MAVSKKRTQVVAEDKQNRFERLAERRVSEAIHRLRLVGNLANRRTYTFTEDHVRQVFDALEAELRQTKAKFRQEGEAGAKKFSFKR